MNTVTIHLPSGKVRTIAGDEIAYHDDGKVVKIFRTNAEENTGSRLVAVSKDFELIELGGVPEEPDSPVEYTNATMPAES